MQQVAVKSSFLHYKLFQHWHIIPLQQREGRAHDPHLQFGVVRPAERIAEGEGHEERARRANLFGDLAQQRKRDCSNASVLNRALNQSNGLMAHGSDRSQQDDIYAIRSKATGYFWRRRFD